MNLITPSIECLLAYDRINPKGAGTSEAEKLYLFSLLRMLKPQSVLEIGVSRGHMTAWLALALHLNGSGVLKSVDNWSRAHGGEATDSSYAFRRLKANGLDKQVTFTKSDSYKFLKDCPDSSYDFVWIDGDHSYEGAKKDIKEAIRVARVMVGVHDTFQIYEGPKKAVEDLVVPGMGCWIRGGRGIWTKNLL